MKLSEEQVRDAQARRKKGEPISSLAKEIGVTPTALRVRMKKLKRVKRTERSPEFIDIPLKAASRVAVVICSPAEVRGIVESLS